MPAPNRIFSEGMFRIRIQASHPALFAVSLSLSPSMPIPPALHATLVCAALFILPLQACKDATAPQLPGEARLVGVPPARAAAGDVLHGIGVVVLDTRSNPLAGVVVEFTVHEGGGTLSSPSATTGRDGVARVEWTLGTVPRENVLEARIQGTQLAPVTVRVETVAGPPARLAITPDSIRINAVTYTTRLAVSAVDRFGNATVAPPSVTWSTLDAAVVEAGADGVVRARRNGRARVVAASGGLADTAVVNVRQVAISAVLGGFEPNLRIDRSVRLQVAGVDSAGQALVPAAFAWTSADTTVAVVDSEGVVTGRGVGAVEITGVSGGVRLRGLLNGETDPVVTAGSEHACALARDGEAFCWGSNSAGQLGIGSTAPSATARAVTTGLRFKFLQAKSHRTCGLTNDGNAYCWGSNGSGQLGNGSSGSEAFRTVPVKVTGNVSFTAIRMSLGHVCGLTGPGAAYCWGENSNGELGQGRADNGFGSPVPLPVAGGLSFRRLLVGDLLSCGMSGAGQLYCWGRIWGFADSTRVRSPTLVTPKLTISQLDVGMGFGCAVDSAGVAFCWGWNNSGQLGDGTIVDNPEPQRVLGGLVLRSIERAATSTCGLSVSSEVYCWGANDRGQLGAGLLVNRSTTPVQVVGGHRFATLTSGAYYSCGLTDSGTVYCWGTMSLLQPGDGNTASRVPVAVQGLPAPDRMRP